MLKFEIKKSLLKKLNKIQKKDNKSYLNIYSKLNEIILSNNPNHYKNLKKPMQDVKRVHVNSHFILTFKYYKKEERIEFIEYKHHDETYF